MAAEEAVCEGVGRGDREAEDEAEAAVDRDAVEVLEASAVVVGVPVAEPLGEPAGVAELVGDAAPLALAAADREAFALLDCAGD